MRALKNTELKLVAGGYSNPTGREEPSNDVLNTMKGLAEIAKDVCSDGGIGSISTNLGSSSSGNGSLGNQVIGGSGTVTLTENGSATIECNNDKNKDKKKDD